MYQQQTALRAAVSMLAPLSVVRALIASFPDAVKEKTDVVTGWGSDRPTGGGDTVLHTLATTPCSSTAECRHTNALCFALVQKWASITATNGTGQTPAETASASATVNIGIGDGGVDFSSNFGGGFGGAFGNAIQSSKPNYHLIASFREVALFKKYSHLSRMHFRDWTTVSHAWCKPSAQLSTLTVLLAGETYKRKLLPRLPMDCWYRILNCIPRHELRFGGCEPYKEKAALAEYSKILKVARDRIKEKEKVSGK